MQEKARVMAIEKNIVSVIALDIEVCIGCSNSECKTNGSVFLVANSRQFDIRVGSEVRIGAGFKNQIFQGFISVGIPVVLAIGAWFTIPVVISASGEGFQVGGVLGALVIGAVLVYRISGIFGVKLPEILEVV